MTVDVGDELREFIDSLVKAGDYRTQSEVMRDALRSLREKAKLNHAFRTARSAGRRHQQRRGETMEQGCIPE
jgi:putative addiction module CopG family antidote